MLSCSSHTEYIMRPVLLLACSPSLASLCYISRVMKWLMRIGTSCVTAGVLSPTSTICLLKLAVVVVFPCVCCCVVAAALSTCVCINEPHQSSSSSIAVCCRRPASIALKAESAIAAQNLESAGAGIRYRGYPQRLPATLPSTKNTT